MRFFTKLAAVAVAAATIVSANTVSFVNQDETNRLIVFTPNAGQQGLPSVEVPGMSTKKVSFPQGWIGNWYSVSEGAPNVPGMLGEVTFDGWNGITYFDVSAIVNPADHDGVKEMYPAAQAKSLTKTLVSGCIIFPCPTAYYLPDDVQTVTTQEKDLICTLGNSVETAKREESHLVSRNYVLGKLS